MIPSCHARDRQFSVNGMNYKKYPSCTAFTDFPKIPLKRVFFMYNEFR